MSTPELWLIAGPNGAGKTTFIQKGKVRALLPEMIPLNADERTKELLALQGYSFASAPEELLITAFKKAADSVFAEMEDRLSRGEVVCVETALSTDKFRPVVERINREGGVFALLYIALASPELAQHRVAIRVKRGGHDVPTEKTVARWKRSIEKLGWFAKQADVFWVYDNSDADPKSPPLLIAHGGNGKVTIHKPDSIPEITRVLESAFA